MRWAPNYQRTLLVLGAVVLVAQPVCAQGDEEGAPPERDILWFRHISVAHHLTNFTTYPPEGSGYTHPPTAHIERGSWSWRTGGVPERWEVAAGTEMRLVVYLSGLDKADLVLVPTGDASRPLGVPFEVVLHAPYGLGALAQGEYVLPIEPRAAPEGVVRVEIPLVADEDAVYGENDPLEVDLHVYGRGRKYTPLRLHIQDEDAATHLVLPGFPVDAFRTWEDEGVPQSVCLDHRMRGEPCPEYWNGTVGGRVAEPSGGQDRDQRADAPLPTGVAAAAVATALWLRGRRGWMAP